MEYPPLLPVGWHSPTPADLCAMCVERFPASATRKRLWEKLARILAQLNGLGICSDFWLDGSFLTEKLDPNDFDYVVHVSNDTYTNLSGLQKEFIVVVRDKLRQDKECDGKLLVTYPEGHEFHAEWEAVRSRLHSLFSFSRDLEFKGIVRYTFPSPHTWDA